MLTEEQKQQRRDNARNWNREARKDPVKRAILNERSRVCYHKKYHDSSKGAALYINRAEVRRANHINRVSEIKLALGCADCGYKKHPRALDFDHRPGEVKLFTIGNHMDSAWKKIEAEIAKCDVVCANCHRIRTFNRGLKSDTP
jgi:hypothetical protein